MRTVTLWGCNLLLALMFLGGQHPLPPATIPAPFPAPEPPHPGLPIDQPPVVVHGGHRHPPDLAKMKKQAEELAKLAQSIPPDIDKVSKGQLSKDLPSRLKRIDKLSKQLRRELSQ